VGALQEHFPGARVTRIAAGLRVIAELPERYGPQRTFLERAAAAGVEVRAPSEYVHARAEDDGAEVRLVLGYAHVPPARIRDGVRLMREAAGR
jgi:GntR family transcriptional regulator / MocR family aminotransferase